MFPRERRLTSKRDFQFVFAKPYKVSFKYLIALYRANSYAYPRLGVIIGKQHVRRAVDRNRLRRVVRESFRHHQEKLKGLDIIVLLRSQCTPLLRDDVDTIWQQLVIP
jgi:ribonuclease P protein component